MIFVRKYTSVYMSILRKIAEWYIIKIKKAASVAAGPNWVKGAIMKRFNVKQSFPHVVLGGGAV